MPETTLQINMLVLASPLHYKEPHSGDRETGSKSDPDRSTKPMFFYLHIAIRRLPLTLHQRT